MTEERVSLDMRGSITESFQVAVDRWGIDDAWERLKVEATTRALDDREKSELILQICAKALRKPLPKIEIVKKGPAKGTVRIHEG